jgi:hypothetical protein
MLHENSSSGSSAASYRRLLSRENLQLGAIVTTIALLALSLYSVAREAGRLLEAIH